MKISAAALLFLILAAALGPSAHGSPGGESLSQIRELGSGTQTGTRVVTQRKGVPRPSHCCPNTAKTIQCPNMKSYYRTSRSCYRPAVIFNNKWGKEVCANPRNVAVQRCIQRLNQAKKLGKVVG